MVEKCEHLWADKDDYGKDDYGMVIKCEKCGREAEDGSAEFREWEEEVFSIIGGIFKQIKKR